jgi:hypothetical protein
MSSTERIVTAPRTEDWSMPPLFFGSFWYLWHRTFAKGVTLLAITLLSLGLGAPAIWIYCGWRGRTDLFERELSQRGAPDIQKI